MFNPEFKFAGQDPYFPYRSPAYSCQGHIFQVVCVRVDPNETTLRIARFEELVFTHFLPAKKSCFLNLPLVFLGWK